MPMETMEPELTLEWDVRRAGLVLDAELGY
jgi:hypothetical protein